MTYPNVPLLSSDAAQAQPYTTGAQIPVTEVVGTPQTGLDFAAIKALVANLTQQIEPAGLFNPFGNTSLTNQINQEIVDLKDFANALASTPGLLEDSATLLIKRLAQAAANLDAETKEANASTGSRSKEIKDIYNLLLQTQKDIFDLEYAKFAIALHHVKFRENQYKPTLHPVQNFFDTREIRNLPRYAQAANEVDATQIVIKNVNQFESVNMMGWARAKYKLIDESIRERIKLKLAAIIATATFWGVRHEVALALHKIFYGANAATSGAHTTVSALPVMGDPSAALHGAATTAPAAPAPAPTSECDKILGGIGGGITACLGGIGTLAKDCKADCCNCGNCNSCSSSCPTNCDCSACSNACGDVVNAAGRICTSVSDVLSSCFRQIDCSACCSNTLQMFESCLSHLGNCLTGCPSATSTACNDCCGAVGNCCCSPQSNNTTIYYFNCNGSGSCSCPRCCNNSCDSTSCNFWSRSTHSETDVRAEIERQAAIRQTVHNSYLNI